MKGSKLKLYFKLLTDNIGTGTITFTNISNDKLTISKLSFSPLNFTIQSIDGFDFIVEDDNVIIWPENEPIVLKQNEKITRNFDFIGENISAIVVSDDQDILIDSFLSSNYKHMIPYDSQSLDEITEKKVIGLYSEIFSKEKDYSIYKIPFTKLTHIFYGNFLANPNQDEYEILKECFDITLNPYHKIPMFGFYGEITPVNYQSTLYDIETLIYYKKQHPHIKLIYTVGGKDLSWNFSNIISNDKSRRTFIDSIIDYINENGFDGVNIYWNDYNTCLTKDIINFVNVIKGIKNEIKSPLEISCTLTCSMGDVYRYNDLIDNLDYVLIECFDYAENHADSKHSCALFHNNEDEFNEKSTAHSSISFILNDVGINPEKVIMGIPVYGRGWSDVDSYEETNQIYGIARNGVSKNKYCGEVGIMPWKHISEMINSGEMSLLYDNKAKTSYGIRFIDGKKEVWSFIDPVSLMYRMTYMMEKQLGGIYFKEIADDANGIDSLVTSAYNYIIDYETESNTDLSESFTIVNNYQKNIEITIKNNSGEDIVIKNGESNTFIVY